jgi:hypothetical protein
MWRRTNLCWNATEAGPRALWRIVAQILMALLNHPAGRSDQRSCPLSAACRRYCSATASFSLASGQCVAGRSRAIPPILRRIRLPAASALVARLRLRAVPRRSATRARVRDRARRWLAHHSGYAAARRRRTVTRAGRSPVRTGLSRRGCRRGDALPRLLDSAPGQGTTRAGHQRAVGADVGGAAACTCVCRTLRE